MMEIERVAGEVRKDVGRVVGMVEDRKRVVPRCLPKVSSGRSLRPVE